MRRSNLDVADQVTALASLPRDELMAQWQKAYGSAPPKGVRHEFLVRSAAWHLQARHFGGLLPATQRALKAAMAEVEGENHNQLPDPHADRSPFLTRTTV